MTDMFDGAEAPPEPDIMASIKAAILPKLLAKGIACVVIRYDGGGDEGQVHEIAAFCADGRGMEIPSIACQRHQRRYDGAVTLDTVLLQAALENLAIEVLCGSWPGWEDGEGAYGELEVKASAGEATLTHHARFVDYETSVTEL